jgi:DNA recombination protein RmuC
MVEAIAAVVALVAGLGIGWFVWGRQVGAISNELRSESVRRAAAETNLDNERRALQSVQDSQARLAETFKALSAEALKSTSTQFLELAKKELEVHQTGAKADLEKRQQAIDAMVKPLQDSLKQVDGKLGEMEKSRVAAYSALTEQVRGLVETQLPRLQGETANLVKALRQPGVRGRWGEMQLKRVVEMAQMLEHCDFVQQETRGNEDTGRLRPDLIVRLPGGKQVVVDAKTPLASYIDAIEAPDEATQQQKLADHARQVRDHMTALGRKAYWDQFQPSPEFVVMFLPGEMFFSAALQQDASLIESGVSEKVIPATPTTLIALLRAVAYGWRQEALAKNAQEVADLGKQLYERIATMTDHWSAVGNRLDQAVKSYNDAVSSLESRVLVSARKLRDLKAGADDVEVKTLEPVERAPRKLQAVPTLPKPGQE